MTSTRTLAALALLAAWVPAQDAPSFAELVAEVSAGSADAGAFVARFEAGAERHAGTAEAVPFLLWILEHAGPHRQATTRAVAALVRDHADDPRAAVAARRLPYLYPILGDAGVREHLDALVGSDDTEVQAEARLSRASLFLTRWGSRATEEARRQAELDLAATKELTRDPGLRQRAAALDLSPRDLGVGELAPEIFGLDLDGVPFKLSDYRGKVVVIDFWGDW